MTVKSTDAPARETNSPGHISTRPQFPTIADRCTLHGNENNTTHPAGASQAVAREPTAHAETDGTTASPVKVEPDGDEKRVGLAAVEVVAATRATRAPTSSNAWATGAGVARVKVERGSDGDEDAALLAEGVTDGRVCHPSVHIFDHDYTEGPTGVTAEAAMTTGPAKVKTDNRDASDPVIKAEHESDHTWSDSGSADRGVDHAHEENVRGHPADTEVYPLVASVSNETREHTNEPTGDSTTTGAEYTSREANGDDEFYDAEDSTEDAEDHTEDHAKDAEDGANEFFDAIDTPRCGECGRVHLHKQQFYQNCTAFVGPQRSAAGLTAYHPWTHIHGDAARKVPVTNISNAAGVEIAVRASLARCLAEARRYADRVRYEDRMLRGERRYRERARREERVRYEKENVPGEVRRREMLRSCGYASSGAVPSLSSVTQRRTQEMPRADVVPVMGKRKRNASEESDEEGGRMAKASSR